MKRSICVLLCFLAVCSGAMAQDGKRTIEPDASSYYSDLGQSRIALFGTYSFYFGSVSEGFDTSSETGSNPLINGGVDVHFSQMIQDYLYFSVGIGFGGRYCLDFAKENQDLWNLFVVSGGLGGAFRPASWVQISGGFELGYLQVTAGEFQDIYSFSSSSGSVSVAKSSNMNGLDLALVFGIDFIVGESFFIGVQGRYDHGLFFADNKFETGKFEHLGFPTVCLGLGVFFE